MPAILRQQYTDPDTGVFRVRDVHIDTTIIRNENALKVGSDVHLTIEPTVILNKPEFHKNFDTVFSCPDDVLFEMLDGKRTYVPHNCQISRLLEPNNGFNFKLESSIVASIGDPICVYSDFNYTNVVYGIIESINDNNIKIISLQSVPNFIQGAFLENLANRQYKGCNVIGAKSQLGRPPAFSIVKLEKEKNSIKFTMNLPMNRGIVKFYDVYVRTNEFNFIEPHWVPDKTNVSVEQINFSVNSYGGGSQAGGGPLEQDKKYFVAVICKDREGFVGANESECKCRTVV